MPRIVINEDRCKGCGLCQAACPKKIIAFSNSFNEKGYHPVYCIDQEQCIGCAFCALTCPDLAITAVYR